MEQPADVSPGQRVRHARLGPDGLQAPVGVFDSGVGGITILDELLRELPNERFVYFGDTGNCPYGVRSEREIQELSIAGARLLLDHGAKIIVVACNTASVSALKELREACTIPFVGVVPAVKPAAERTHVGRVGVAATEASARGDYLKRLITEHANGVEVLAVGCPRLVTLVEAGQLDGPTVEAVVREDIAPLLEAGIDELVLGCTHFPALRSVFERVAGPGVEVIDSGAAIARQTRRVLERAGMLASGEPHMGGPAETARPIGEGDLFLCSGPVATFEETTSAILGQRIQARRPGSLLAPVV
ncbi:MAG TPA: glutamate racemase [Ktedonobacterales bacterium]